MTHYASAIGGDDNVSRGRLTPRHRHFRQATSRARTTKLQPD